jgi:phage/plasmid primase-like uncharacterized protein
MKHDSAFAEWFSRARAVRIEDEVARRGVTLFRHTTKERAGPCPKCGGVDRFSVSLIKQLWRCRMCDTGGDIISLIQHVDEIDFIAACTKLANDPPPRSQTPKPRRAKLQTEEEYEREHHDKAAWLWSQRRPISGTPAETYLRARGITCALPATLGYLPAHDKHDHALLAAFAIVDEPEPGVLAAPRCPRSVHIIRLLPDGSDRVRNEGANKITIGSAGALPIVLAPPNDLGGLAIAEGIEDALWMHQATGLGAWAACSAVRLSGLAGLIGSCVECVSIAVDNDDAGRRYSAELAQRLTECGVETLMVKTYEEA